MGLCLISAFLLYASFALGCTCINSSVPKIAMQHADVVFHGRVSKIDHLRNLQAPDPETGSPITWIPEKDDVTLVTFNVDAIWKGTGARQMKVLAVVSPFMCDGYQFDLGSEYTVFADRPIGKYPLLEIREDKNEVYDIGFCPGPMIPGSLSKGVAALGKARKLAPPR